MKKEKIDIAKSNEKSVFSRSQEGIHSVNIAKEITTQELYFKKDGSFVDEKQVRLCASNNKDLSVCLSGNMIKNIVQEPKVIVNGSKSDLGKCM